MSKNESNKSQKESNNDLLSNKTEESKEEENLLKEKKYQELNNKLSKLLEDYDMTSSQLKSQKEENEKMNSIKNEISQRMILDKKEIEEMLKNELNFGSPINNENKQEEKKQEIKDKGNI